MHCTLACAALYTFKQLFVLLQKIRTQNEGSCGIGTYNTAERKRTTQVNSAPVKSDNQPGPEEVSNTYIANKSMVEYIGFLKREIGITELKFSLKFSVVLQILHCTCNKNLQSHKMQKITTISCFSPIVHSIFQAKTD